MSNRERAPVRERRRVRTIYPNPQGIALFASGLLVSFRSNAQIHAIDCATSDCSVWTSTPGTAWGLAAGADRAWAVCGWGPDNDRHLFEFDLNGRQIGEPLRCPDGTGSYISHDGRDLFLCQWYNRRVFRLTRSAEFEPVLTAKRGICGIAAEGRSLTLLTTSDEHSDDYFLERYDLSDPVATGTDVARVPFRARSLAWTGSEYLTNHREAGEIVAFSAD